MKESRFIGAISACAITFCISMPVQALTITLGSTTIVDGDVNDLNGATGVIDFSLTGINGGSGTYDASGTLTEAMTGTSASISSTAMTLTNLDIMATSGAVSDTILFQSTAGPIISLPATGNVELDGNWTSGSATNAVASVTGGGVALSAYLFGDWEWGVNTVTNGEFFVPFGDTSTISSGSGSSFGPVVSSSLTIPAANTDPFLGQVLTQADFTSIIGKLDFTLANSGDGLWLPGSADVQMVSSVPVPAAFWLFGSGLVGLIGFAKRKKA